MTNRQHAIARLASNSRFFYRVDLAFGWIALITGFVMPEPRGSVATLAAGIFFATASIAYLFGFLADALPPPPEQGQ